MHPKTENYQDQFNTEKGTTKSQEGKECSGWFDNDAILTVGGSVVQEMQSNWLRLQTTEAIYSLFETKPVIFFPLF